MKQIKLTVQARDQFGRGPNRRLRASGRVPAVIYGKHHEPASLSVDGPEIKRLLKALSGTTALIELSQDNSEPRLSVVQEIQRNPITDEVIHIDFHEVSAKEEMHTHVALHVIGEAFGTRNQNGLLEIISHQVDIQCLPKDLPEFIEIDVTELKVGESIHVGDLKKLDGVKYLADEDQVVIACTEQRVDTAVTVEETETAEPEKAEDKEAKKAE